MDKKEYNKLYLRKYRKLHLEKCRAYSRKYYSLHREEELERLRTYYISNPDKQTLRHKKYYEANKDKAILYGKDYIKKNRVKNRLWANTRRAAVLRAIPAWANKNLILEVYKQAEQLTITTGIKHHVDHIIPLKGKTVCGLHVENNLCVIPATQNLKKAAKFEG